MLPMLLFITVVLALVLSKLTQEERIQLFHRIVQYARLAFDFARRWARSTPEGCEEFYAALKERTRWSLVTPALLLAYVTFYVLMNAGASGANEEQLLLHWGGSIGPLTTNGEWWRLGIAMFLHWGLLHLIADVTGLAQVGVLTERIVGPTAFALVFVAAGLITGLQELSVHPVAVSAGAAGGIFGVYGLLLATLAWGWVRRSPLTIPLAVLKRLLPGAVVFLLYNAIADGLVTETMTWGLGVGFAGGSILVWGVGSHKPPMPRLCTSMVATLALVIAFAVPLRGMADVTREAARVIELETRTAAAYDAEVAKFRRGRQSADKLANMAEAINSDVRGARISLSELSNIPPEHQSVVDDALQYLLLREESWRLRVEGLRTGRMQTLQKAERVESEAKTRFEKVKALKSAG